MTDNSSKVVKSAVKPPNAGKGRKKGVPNKTTAKIKDMIIQALDNKGGVAYLMNQADENPVAFMSLIAKVLPTQLTGDDGDDIKVAHSIELIGVAANAKD